MATRMEMNQSTDDGEPTKFMLELKEKANLLLIYDDTRYAEFLKCLFLKSGLSLGGRCVYLSSDSIQNVEKRMNMHGIDVDKFMANNRIQIFNASIRNIEKITDILDKLLKNNTRSDSQVRIILQADEISDDRHKNALLIESRITAASEKSNISVLSSYNAEFFGDAGIMQQIINMHDYAIFAPPLGRG
jgi:archaellum biogenesis ATPase FlaH